MYASVARFLIVGGTVTLLNLILLWIFVSMFGCPYLASSVVAYAISAGGSFCLQRSWTFGSSGDRAARQFPPFLMINLLGLILNSVILCVLTAEMGLWYVLAQAVASSCVAIQSFLGYRWLFQVASRKSYPLKAAAVGSHRA